VRSPIAFAEPCALTAAARVRAPPTPLRLDRARRGTPCGYLDAGKAVAKEPRVQVYEPQKSTLRDLAVL
jgi:hypothetical protein